MNIIRSSEYRRMQTCAAKWLRNTYKASLFGFDIKIQGKYYSVAGLDKQGRTFAILIFETAKDFLSRKTEVIVARGKFMRVMVMFPSQGVYTRTKTEFGSVGVLAADLASWRGAWRIHPGQWYWTNSKLISVDKLKDCIMRRNSESLNDLIEWIATSKGKSVDSIIISNLRHKCTELTEALELERDKLEVKKYKEDAFYIFASKFASNDTIRKITSLGARDYYISREKRKETANEIEKNGYSSEGLPAAVKAIRLLCKKLDEICKACDLNKGKAKDDQHVWSSCSQICSNCKSMAMQAHMVKSTHKYEALCAKKRISRERGLR